MILPFCCCFSPFKEECSSLWMGYSDETAMRFERLVFLVKRKRDLLKKKKKKKGNEMKKCHVVMDLVALV